MGSPTCVCKGRAGGNLWPFGGGGVDHKLKALLGGRELRYVVFRMGPSNVLLH